MRSFKEQLEKDFDDSFFNLNEFAEIHDIDGKEIPVVVDNETLLQLNRRNSSRRGKTADYDGIFQDNRMFFVLKKYLPDQPVIDQIMEFDREPYKVGNVLEDFGGYTIVLKENAG